MACEWGDVLFSLSVVGAAVWLEAVVPTADRTETVRGAVALGPKSSGISRLKRRTVLGLVEGRDNGQRVSYRGEAERSHWFVLLAFVKLQVTFTESPVRSPEAPVAEEGRIFERPSSLRVSREVEIPVDREADHVRELSIDYSVSGHVRADYSSTS